MNFVLSSDLTEGQRGQLAVEVQFYGLLRLMMPTEVPYYAQEQIGVALLKGACAFGTKFALQSAVAMARALVFEMGSTSPWLTAEYQDAQYVITDHVGNGAPVWAAEDREQFMFRAEGGNMMISNEDDCTAGRATGVMCNTVKNPDVLAPTQLLSNTWQSLKCATLGPQFTSARHYPSAPEWEGTEFACSWVGVPDMRISAVHGLDDAKPAMAAALRQLAALTDNA